MPGSTVHGTVAQIADYGAVVDLGGVRGLVHRSELTWGRLESVDAVVSVGDEVDVVVLDVNRSKRRVGLSLRATAPDHRPDVLLRTEMSAGHGGVSGRYKAWHDRAFALAWMLDRMGLADS